MKNLISLILLAIVAWGCNSSMKNENAELKAELAALAEENAMLAAGEMDMELKVEEYQMMLQEIDENIAAIDEKHNTVKELTADNAEDVEEDILLHLEHVHGTMANTKHKINHLQKNIDELYKDEAADDVVIAALEDQLDEAALEIVGKDMAIDALNEEVIEEGIVIDHLSEAYQQQAAISDVLYGILNTAYVVVGTKKELKKFGIIEGEGGFIGLGRVKSLAADADDEWFIPIAIDQTDDIELSVKKVKLLTTHPEASYELMGDKVTESLIILDKAAFWDKSDFLVLEVEKD